MPRITPTLPACATSGSNQRLIWPTSRIANRIQEPPTALKPPLLFGRHMSTSKASGGANMPTTWRLKMKIIKSGRDPKEQIMLQQNMMVI
mmetsp:Transcript_88123/g.174887  ORF Transcript_88123/g.174887 Transcript_88123/m.174887 type:complete len:90 (-) Transcript_88123:332-601(-)